LKVLKQEGRNNCGQLKWKCRCDCGEAAKQYHGEFACFV
jgi:hypothetical protein